jgi:DNA-binding CsgD family transcriptional regulator
MKKNNDNLEVYLDLFKTVFEKAPNMGINLLNKNYTVLWANKAMAIGSRKELHEMIGQPCYKAFRDRKKPCDICILQIVSKEKKSIIMERSGEYPERKPYYVEIRAYPIFDKNNTIKYVFEILIPIDKEKKAQEQQRKYIESLEKSIKELNANSQIDSKIKLSKNKNLTLREQEILKLISQGFSNIEIASILKISLDTVKTHVKNIFLKLDVSDRTKAAVWASSHNLI